MNGKSTSKPIDVLNQINDLSRDFGQRLRRGKKPEIEEFFLRVSPEARVTLFSSLLGVEINYRRSRGDSPSSSEYLKRFPEYSAQVRRAFFEPSMVSVDSDNTAELVGDTRSVHGSDFVDARLAASFEVLAGRSLGDYELVGELGRGGMGVVYEARHVKTGNRVALKMLPSGEDGRAVDANKLYRFRREFRSLSEVNHPNLVGMQTLEVDGSQWFFTMDLIEGEDFLSYVRPEGELDEQRLRSSLPQLVSGVLALHGRGIIHRDLKPGNVLVSEQGRVSVLDFGLVAELQKTADMTQTRSGMFAGTPRYAAPEQMFGERTEASDWYALGTMLYEALTGNPPFVGKNQMAVLRQKQQEDPPTLSDDRECPSDLAGLVEGLIQREPDKRLTAEEICACLNLNDETRLYGSTVPSKGSHASSGSVDDESGLDDEAFEDEEIVLIGREKQLAQLEEIKETFLRKKQPSVVWVTGLSGEGKSSLVEKFLQPIRKNQEMLVLSGRCYDRESVPFKAMDCLIDPLVRYLRSLPERDLNRVLPDDISMLAHLFPMLYRSGAIADPQSQQFLSLDSKQIRYRAFEAFRELLATIGERIPIILFIDDLQWGDADSSSALQALLFGDDPPPVLFLGTYRSDERDDSSFQRQWLQFDHEKHSKIPQHELSIAPLDKKQCVALVAVRTGASEAEAQKAVAGLFENTKGNPYFMEQMIEGFSAGAADWRPMPLAEIIIEKLRRLAHGSDRLLQRVAVAGRATQASELAAVSGLGSDVFSLLTHMRSERLLRLVGSGDNQLVDTWHDKIRETMLARMDTASRQAMHLEYAESIESSEGLNAAEVESFLVQPFTTQAAPKFATDRIYDLAYHFQLACDDRACIYQLLAGEMAFQSYASEEAIEYLSKGRELLSSDNSTRLHARLWHRLATLSCRVMKFDRSIEQFEIGVQFADSNLERAWFFTGIATVHQTRSNYEAATEYHDLALREIKKKRPLGLLAYIQALLCLGKFAFLPESWLRGPKGKKTEEERLELAIYCDMVQYMFDRYVPIIEYPIIFLRLGGLAYRFEKVEFSAGVGLLAGHLALNGFPKMGKRHARRAVARINIRTDLNLEATARYSVATALSYAGDFEESALEFQNAVEMFSKSGSHFRQAVALHMLRHLHEATGSASEEMRVSMRLVELTKNSGDLRSLLMGHYDHAASLARFGSLQSSFDSIGRAHDIWKDFKPNAISTIYLANRSFVFLQGSRYDEARDIAENSWETSIKHLRIMDVCLRGLAWYLESVSGPNWNQNTKVQHPRLIRKRCRWARLLSFLHLKIRPHLLRSRGRAFTALGKTRKGIRNFEMAVKSARQLGMKYDLGKSLLDLAAVKEEGREENRAEAIRLLKEMESVIPRAESWLLGDQYDEAVIAPEFDLEAWERDHGSVVDLAESPSRD